MSRVPLVVEALGRDKPEERLTALLAVVAQQSNGFTRLLLETATKEATPRWQLPDDLEYDLDVEVMTASGWRVDLQILARSSHLGHVGRLWIESKLDAPFQKNQLANYAKDLAELYRPGAGDRRWLAAVVPSWRRGEVSPTDRWSVLDWSDVALQAWTVGFERSGNDPAWREKADDPLASGEQRLLHELLAYLEAKGIAVVDPVRHHNVQALAYAQESIDILWELIGRTAELSDLDADGGVGWSRSQPARMWQVLENDGDWAADLDGYPEILCQDTDPWTDDRIDQPAIGLGYTLPTEYYETLNSAGAKRWRDGLLRSKPRITVGFDGDRTRVFHTVYLAELTTAGATLDQQARFVAERLNATVKRLRDVPPDALKAMKQEKGGS